MPRWLKDFAAPRATIEKFGRDWTKPGNMVSNGRGGSCSRRPAWLRRHRRPARTGQCGNDANDNKSCNKAGDELMRQASASADPVRRKALMTQALRVEMDDYPMIPLLQYSLPRLVKPWIGGYDDANDQDIFRSKDFYVIRH